MSERDRSRVVLFAALAGSVRRHEALDDGAAARAVARARERMESAVASFGGRLLRVVGGELAALFDDTEAACAAFREMQQEFSELPPEAGQRPTLRGGLAHGDVGELGGGGDFADDQGRALGPTVTAAAHLAGWAEPGQLLLSAAAWSRLPAAWQAATLEVAGRAPGGSSAPMRVFELLAAPAVASHPHFVVRYGDQRLPLDEQGLPLSIGRDASCALIVNDRRASRLHAHIERRGARVVLVDHSSNGTFVSFNGQAELFVRGGECVLHGRGLICFSASASEPGADCAQFVEAPQ